MPSSLSCYNPALESAVDAFASRLLRLQSAQETVIDPSVGPYVTSVIRSSLSADDALSSVSDFSLESMMEFDSLMELIQDHCGMDPQVSKEVLQRIALAVRTGVVTECEESAHMWSTISPNISSSHESTIHSYGHGTDIGQSTAQETLVWNDRYNTLNGGTKPMSVHLGTSYSNGDNMAFPPYVEDGTLFQDEVKYSYQDEPSRVNEQNFRPSYSFSESDYSNYRTVSPVLAHSSNCIGGVGSTFPSSSIVDPHYVVPSSINSITDHLIPVDLLGVIEDTRTHLGSILLDEGNTESSVSNHSPSLHLDESEGKGEATGEYTISDYEEKSNGLSGNKIKGKKGKNKATDIAALLFKPSRPRSNSVQELKSPKLQTPSLPSVPSLSALSFSNSAAHYSTSRTGSFSHNLEATAQILLSLNPTICEEAAYEATVMAESDINLAQHVIDAALSAPPVCRHMLNDSCYRSDCQFSHDVDGHTCLFWLKGRCGKGDGCRFLHGFKSTPTDYLPEFYPTAEGGVNRTSTAPSSHQTNQPIQTANLVQHNMKTSREGLSRSGSFDFHSNVNSFHGKTSTDSTSSILFHSSMWKSSSNSSASLSTYTSNKEEALFSAVNSTKTSTLNSFASIASKGYSETSFSCDHIDTSDHSTNEKSFARIPQDLWNANHNRSSVAFQIPDPIARYTEVSRSVIRDDIIDLHFQSLKTFPVVLSQILPEKLQKYKEVWIVSGSGHHVSKNSHQKSGGVLDNAVIEWLSSNEYTNFTRGKDKNGFGGAVLVKR